MPDDTFPAWDLVRTAHAVQRRLVDAFEHLELSPIQFGVLIALESDQRLSQADLAREVLVTPQSMSVLMAALLERGFVERDEPAGRGGRAGLVLSQAGRAVLQRVRPHVQTATAGESLGLDESETAALVDLLARVRADQQPNPHRPPRGVRP